MLNMGKDSLKEQSKTDKLFEACKAGAINTKMFKDITGRTIRIGGKADYSKFSGRDLRELRKKQARKALDEHYEAGGDAIDESGIVELWV